MGIHNLRKLTHEILGEWIIRYGERGYIEIRSPYVCIAKINTLTGKVENGYCKDVPHKEERDFFESVAAKQALFSVDNFTGEVPVYYVSGVKIIKTTCYKIGYPNLTKGGFFMNDNTAFNSRWKAYRYSINNNRLQVKWEIDYVLESLKNVFKRIASLLKAVLMFAMSISVGLFDFKEAKCDR